MKQPATGLEFFSVAFVVLISGIVYLLGWSAFTLYNKL